MATSTEQEQLASLAGFSVAFFNSNAELKNLFNTALKGNWEPDRLLQAARNTNWFKKSQAAARELQLLRTSDPAEYNARAAEMRLRVANIAAQVGHAISNSARDTLTALALRGAWNDDQIRAYMGNWNYVSKTVKAGGILGGQIGEIQVRLNKALQDNGMRMSSTNLGRYLQGIASGKYTEQTVMAYIQNTTASAFPGLAEELRSGISLRQLAEPYIQSMGKLLELNPETVDLFDNTIRNALSTKGKDGKFSPLTLAEFETRLRKDKRWLKTDNAQDGLMEAGHQVLKAFGVTW